MAGKRKELEKNSSPVIKKKIKKSKPNKDFSDDEDLSDIEDAGEIFSGIRIPPILPPVTAAEENPGPRLIIKNIVANNFKSYFGKVTIGPFHKSLTSIVGANGSGKSNVIDSLLFVFGYRSSKIRSKKVSVLIHNSEKHRDVLQCSVTVNFMLINDDDTKENGYVVVPDSELTITRTANKDNSSFYTLNNKRVKFKDVAIILKKNGIDLIHNRFLILQGEVEQIAMMKPKAENDHSTGMLEYLEDIIGTVRYKEPILKLEEKVNDLSLEKSEKLSRLKYVVKERGELIEPVKEIIQYQQQENKLNWQKNKNYQKELFKLNEKIDADTEKLQKTKDEINSIDNELAGFEKKKENENKIIGDFSVKLQTDIKKLDKLGKEIQICNQKSDKIKHSLLDKTNEIKQYENSVVQEKKKITKAEAVPKVKECELKRLESELTSLEEECMTLEENYTKIHSSGFEKSKKFREKKESLVPDELKLQTIFGNKQNLFQTLKTEFEVLLDTEKSEKEKLRVLEEQMTKGVDEFQENERKKEKAEADMNNFRNKIRDWEENIQNLKNDEQEIKTKLQNIRQSLTEKRTAYAETTGRSRPIQYVLKLKDQGRINGILGRCGDYGQVEGKYDIPVCTACGSTDQIVVETSEAAQSCIDMLKKNKIGRLTFSVLPQIQQYQPNADAVHTYPENSIRVFDLIKILDQRFRLTFYTGLYETLLAEDLDQARRISFRPKSRLRVVTFKGEIIDKSGIISGGGKPIRGKIGPQETRAKYSSGNTHQVSQNEVEKLDKIAKELENKLRETETKIFDLKDNVEQHSRLIDELNTVIRQCVSRMNAWKAKKIQVENLIETQKLVIVKKKTDPIAVANKEAEIKKAEEELNVAKKDYHSIKSKVDDLNKKIKEITEGEPREAKCLLDEANDKLVKTRTAINQVNVSVEAAERQIKKSKTQIETLKDRIDEAKKEVEALNEDSLEYNSKTAKYNESYDEMKEDIDKQRQHIKELKNKYDDGFQRVNELRESKLTLKRNLKTIEDSITHLLDICDSKKKKLSGLKLHIIRQIDGVVRDPVIESYKEFDKNNKENEEEGENSQKIIVEPQEENDQNQMEVNHEDQNIPKLEDFTNKGLTDLPQFSREQLADFNPNDFENILEKEDEIKKTKPNFILLEEYDKRTKQYNEKYAEVAAVLDLYNSHNDMLNKVRQRRKDEFMVSFTKITIKLKEMYQMITLGGDAELDIVDSLDPFSAGIIFGIRPPKKSWKYMVNLSGGEKTLSSLALVFALHYYKPSPLYVMDEIDAALDFKNVSIIGHYIKERTKNSQFIIISLRSNMFEKANLLVGIYKTDDCTDTSVVKTDEYAHLLKGPLATKYHNQ